MLWHRLASASAPSSIIESVTYTGNVTTTANPTSPFTSATVSFGAAPAAGKRRYLLAVISFSQGGSSGDQTITSGSITIGGQAASMAVVAKATYLNNFMALAFAEVPTGTSGQVAFTFTGSGATSSFVAIYSVVVSGTKNLTLRDTFSQGPLAAASTAITLDVEVGDVAFVGLVVRNGSPTPTLTDSSGFGFSGFDFVIDQNSSEYTSGAAILSSISGTAQTVTITDATADRTSSAIIGTTFYLT
jgi:hypothetical protein